MLKRPATLVILLLCTRAYAQRQGDFDGWAADGRAVVTLLGSEILCTPAPAGADPVEPLMDANEKGKTCVRCEDLPKGACTVKQKPGANERGKLAVKNACKKDERDCAFDVQVGGAVIHHTYENNGAYKVSVAGAFTRADGRAIAVKVLDDQPDNKVSEDAIWIVDLGGDPCAGPELADSPAGLVSVPGAAARGEILKGDLDGDGTDDALFVARSKNAGDPFVVVAALRKGARWSRAACLAQPLAGCPAGGGDAAVRGKPDGKHPVVEISLGCAKAQQSVVWMWVVGSQGPGQGQGKMRQVLEFTSSDRKGITRTMDLVDVDGDGTMEIVITGRKGKETYDPRVTRWDAKAVEFKNDKALSERAKAAKQP